MGAYSPAPVVTPNVHARVMHEIILPTIAGMAADGIPFTGFLYAGLMIDAHGAPKTLEFNCRMGDPETQPIMMRLKSDLFEVLMHATDGTLDQVELQWDRRVALGVVMAAAGYPEAPRKGDASPGCRPRRDDADGVPRRHRAAATASRSPPAAACCASPRSATRRALAQQRAYEALRDIHFDGAQYRSDIGHRAIASADAPRASTRRTPQRRSRLPARPAGAHRRARSKRPRAATPSPSDAWQREPGGKLEGDGLSRLHRRRRAARARRLQLLARRGPGAAAVGDAASRPELAGAPFEAMGVSLVFHPRNPYVPTVHMNVRMFGRAAGRAASRCVWFGGGMDLTPYYGFEETRATSTRACRDALAPFGADKYPRFKRWCDEYFFLKHRNEPRGIGGIFFDDFAEGGFDAGFAMMRAVGDAFLGAYLPIVERRRDTALRRARARLPGLPARPLRRVQPGLRPRHAVRPAVGRAHREHPDVDAAASSPGATTGSPSRARPRRALYSDFLRPRDWVDCRRPRTRMRVGLFGGSFDPLHDAHVALARGRARAAARSTSCAGFRPASRGRRTRRLRQRAPTAWRWCAWRSPASRASCSTARAAPPRRQLHARHGARARTPQQPGDELVLILGQDQYAALHTWRDWRELLALVDAGRSPTRAGDAVRTVDPQHRPGRRTQTAQLEMPMMDISSTDGARARRGGRDDRRRWFRHAGRTLY